MSLFLIKSSRTNASSFKEARPLILVRHITHPTFIISLPLSLSLSLSLPHSDDNFEGKITANTCHANLDLLTCTYYHALFKHPRRLRITHTHTHTHTKTCT